MLTKGLQRGRVDLHDSESSPYKPICQHSDPRNPIRTPEQGNDTDVVRTTGVGYGLPLLAMPKYSWQCDGVSRTWSEVGQILKRRRELDLGLTQPQLGEISDLSVPMIQVLEAGSRDSYSGRTLGKIARGLGWPNDAVEQLLAGVDPAELAPAVEDPVVSIDLNSEAAGLPPAAMDRVLDIIRREQEKQKP